jgi:SAM-dependent methyltransferase
MNKNNLNKWDLWAEFCNYTGREKKWGETVAKILLDKKHLPTGCILDVGCGTGEFTSVFQKYCQKLVGIDPVDLRVKNNFEFTIQAFEEVVLSDVNILLFKQSFHLLAEPLLVFEKWTKSVVVILQMPKPEWAEYDIQWELSPLNHLKNKEVAESLGWHVSVEKLVQSYEIPIQMLEKMFLVGYTSDLQRLTQTNRNIIWEKLKPKFCKNNQFTDILYLSIYEFDE